MQEEACYYRLWRDTWAAKAGSAKPQNMKVLCLLACLVLPVGQLAADLLHAATMCCQAADLDGLGVVVDNHRPAKDLL